MIDKEINEWYQSLYDIHYPRWEELPNLDLYMDQVVTLLERYLSFLMVDSTDRIITPSMINNYVKLKLIPKPVKKQYSKIHLAYLIAIMSLKQVLTIQEIKDGIQYQAGISGTKNAYNYFCHQQEFALKQAIGIVCDDYEVISQNKIENESMIAIKMATRAFASKIIASFVVAKQKENK